MSLYLGIMVGIIGNFFVNVLFEMVNAFWSDSAILWFWVLMFMVSSIVTFQLIKWAMKRFEIAPNTLRAFDFATVILILLGILVWLADFLR